MISASSDKSKNLIENISHEVRTPLGIIMGFAEMLARNDIDEATRLSYVAAIGRNCQALENVINDILHLCHTSQLMQLGDVQPLSSPIQAPVVDPISAEDSLSGMRVLLAEDSEDNQVLIAHRLGHIGIAVDVVDDGEQAVSQMQDSYHAVLMDLQMPRLDGFAATERLRSDGYKGPIFALSADTSPGVREKCLQCGFNEYFDKPLNFAKLYEALRASIRI